jgi:hypothetical protein
MKKLLTTMFIEGDTGNGYYGTGFWFSVVRP